MDFVQRRVAPRGRGVNVADGFNVFGNGAANLKHPIFLNTHPRGSRYAYQFVWFQSQREELSDLRVAGNTVDL